MEIQIKSRWLPAGRGEWTKLDEEHTLFVEFRRARDWIDIRVTGENLRAPGYRGFKESFGYHLVQRRWAYGKVPPTRRILDAVLAALEAPPAAVQDND